MASSTSYFFDYMDFFKAEYNFSNRTSSIAGKMMTFGYMVVFIYLSVQAIINVLNFSDRFFSKTTSYDNIIVENGPNTLNHIHLISYVQLISKSGLPMDRDFRINLFNEYFTAQISSLKSNEYHYSKKNLLDYLCDSKSEILIFCFDFNFNSIDDFLFISINKAQSKNPSEFKNFFDMYSLRIHVDHYFLRSCENKFFYNLSEWNTHMTSLFPEFVEFKLFDYIVNSKGYYTESLTNINYETGLSNTEISYKLDDLTLDTGPLVMNTRSIKLLSVANEKIVKSPNLFSFNVAMISTRDTYSFVYLKLPQAFANVMGIMEACKFVFIILAMVINFLLQNLALFDYFYVRKLKFINPTVEDTSQLVTIIPFKVNNNTNILTNNIADTTNDQKIEMSEKKPVIQKSKKCNNFLTL